MTNDAEQFIEENDIGTCLETDHPVIDNLRRKLQRYGSLSVSQINLLRSIHNRVQARIASLEDHREPKWKPIVEGRRTLTGRILHVKEQDTMYGVRLKMLLHADGDQKLWGAIPQTLIDAVPRDESFNWLIGKRVEFNGTVSKSDTMCFGFYTNPRKAKVTS